MSLVPSFRVTSRDMERPRHGVVLLGEMAHREVLRLHFNNGRSGPADVLG